MPQRGSQSGGEEFETGGTGQIFPNFLLSKYIKVGEN